MSNKRSASEEFVQVDQEEPSSSTSIINITTDTTIFAQRSSFKYINSERINPLLLNSSSFIKALNMVEDLVDNEHLNIYFSHMVIPELRYVNIFHKDNSFIYSNKIKLFLRELLSDLQYDVDILPDSYCTFIGNHSVSSTKREDKIIYDKLILNGVIILEESHRTSEKTLSKQVFFLFVKTLHELSHACIFKSGRIMIGQSLHIHKKNEYFNTPATHALAAEAGNAIERMLFGSVIGVIGRADSTSYIIKDVLLNERKPSGIIDSNWLKIFVDSDIKNLNEIPHITYTELTNKKLKVTKSSPKYLHVHPFDNEDEEEDNDDDDDDDEKEDDDDNDETDDDEPVLTIKCCQK